METLPCPEHLGHIFAEDKNGNKVDVESGEIWKPKGNDDYVLDNTKQPDPDAAKTLFNEKYNKCAGKIKFSVSLAHEKIH